MENSDPSNTATHIMMQNANADEVLLLRKRNKHLAATLAKVVAFAKQKMFEAKQLEKIDCPFCVHGISVVTAGQKAELADRYAADISLSGFHCRLKSHTDLFHNQLHESVMRWSCCENDLFRQED